MCSFLDKSFISTYIFLLFLILPHNSEIKNLNIRVNPWSCHFSHQKPPNQKGLEACRPHQVYNQYQIKAQHSQSNSWSTICFSTPCLCSKLYTIYLPTITFAKSTWQLPFSKKKKCWVYGAQGVLHCILVFVFVFFVCLLLFFQIFIIVEAVLPPPHRRHLARSLPVPRGRMATGGCLTMLAFSVELKK